MEQLKELDFIILDYLQTIHSNGLDKVMKVITTAGDYGYVWIVISIIMICFPKSRKIGYITLLTLIAEVAINEGIIKNIIARERPFIQNTVIDTIIKQPSGYSFPSGHSASSFAAATAIFKQCKKLGIPAYVLAGLIAFSRVYFYVHFLSDVLFGSFLGVMIGIGVNKLVNRMSKKSKESNDSKNSK